MSFDAKATGEAYEDDWNNLLNNYQVRLSGRSF